MQLDDADTAGRLASTAGGVLIALGSLLTWGKVAVSMPGVGTQEASFKGLDTGDGKVLLALGILILAVSLVAFAIRKGVLGAAPVLVDLAGGAFSLVFGVINAQGVKGSAIDYLVEQAGIGQKGFNPAARRVLEAATDTTVGIGLYLVVLGSAVALIGGSLGLGQVRRVILQRRSQIGDAVADDVVSEAIGEIPPPGRP